MTGLMKIEKEFPSLYGKTSKGKIKVWFINVELDENNIPQIRVSHGLQGKKIQTNYKPIVKGKNIGRANETTPLQQAVNEATATWVKQTEKGYAESVELIVEMELPMLAQKFKDSKHRIQWPAMGQPKMNGVRCLAKKIDENTIKYSTRGGKEYPIITHLNPGLLSMLDVGEQWDGEIYYHGWSLQRISSAVKKLNDDTPLLEYWVYDIVHKHVNMNDRAIRYISKIIDLKNSNIIGKDNFTSVPCLTLQQESDVNLYHDEFVQEGFEGIIIRNTDAFYRYDYRSPDLQKYKEFLDEEFEIVGGHEGKGLSAGQCTFECVTKEGKVFGARCRGQNSVREEQWTNLDSYIGKMLTVRFQEWSDEMKPLQPVGIVVRDYE